MMLKQMVTGEVVSHMTAESADAAQSVTVLTIGDNQLRWAVFDSDSNTCISLSSQKCSASQSITQAFLQWCDSNIVAGFQKLHISLSAFPFTLVPLALYDESQQEALLGLEHQNEVGSVVKQQSLQQLEGIGLLSIPLELDLAIKERTPQATVTLQPAQLVEAFITDQTSTSKRKLYLHVGERFLGCYAIDGKSLLAYNQYPIEHPNDILYYTQLVLEQLQWDDVERVRVWGDIGDDKLNQLRPYFKMEEFFGLKFQRISSQVSAADKIAFADIFTLYQCA